MLDSLPRGVRVGGSALPDGVLMLTPLAAAIARESDDGTLRIESFPLPQRKPHPVEKLPFIRILPRLAGQMGLVVKGWRPNRGGGVPIPLLGAAVIIGAISTSLNLAFTAMPSIWHAAGASLVQLALFFAVIAATRLAPRYGRIWRFHGGEHQAIAAYEAGMDLTIENAITRTLYHPRCGTNLATLALVLMIPGMVIGSVVGGVLGSLLTVIVPLAAICVAFEIVMLGQTKLPAVLLPGLAFQRLTVAMPSPPESRAGIAALRAALTEHAKVLGGTEPSTAGAHAAG